MDTRDKNLFRGGLHDVPEEHRRAGCRIAAALAVFGGNGGAAVGEQSSHSTSDIVACLRRGNHD